MMVSKGSVDISPVDCGYPKISPANPIILHPATSLAKSPQIAHNTGFANAHQEDVHDSSGR